MKTIMIIVLCAFTVAAFANPFSDVKFNHWAYDAVTQLSAKGIITGYPDGTFKGNKAVTRYDMAVIIARLLEKLNTTPGIKAKMSKGDLDSVQKLVVEFADELSLLGVKVTALEDEMSAVKDDLAVIKEDVKTLKSTGGQGGKIKITGDNLIRFEDYSWSETKIQNILNDNHFMDKLGLNFDMMIDPDITSVLRLEKFSFWNSSAGDWSSLNAAMGTAFRTQQDTDLRTALAYIQIKDFFGWADQMRFGRQRVALGHDLLMKGVVDGITGMKAVDHKRNIIARVGGLKMNDFDNGLTSPATTNDNSGLDLLYTDWTFDLKDVMAELYYVHQRDPGSQAAAVAPAALAQNACNLEDCTAGGLWRHVKNYSWTGIGLSGNPVPELTLYGEYSWLTWDESVDVNGDGVCEDGDPGYLAGLNWDVNKKTAFKLQYTKFEEWFFRPLTWNGVTAGAVYDTDTYLDPDETFLFSQMGYLQGFNDTMAEVSHNLSEKSTVTARYEGIADNRTYAVNQPEDKRIVLTGIYKYQYKPNTALRLTYRTINAEENTTALAVAGGYPAGQHYPAYFPRVHGTNCDSYGNTSGLAQTDVNAVNINIDDVKELRLQLDVNF
ncbi:MAG: S-layer homology domain-containing protein [Candidatus Wallbacteria bacterium]|nr:S-layer homology domain-containing protein [Candidatus Wallbacteria bacterium]